MRIIRRVPLVLILVATWAALRISGAPLDHASPISWVLVIVCFLVAFAEFYKSGDVTLSSFKIDLAFAVAGTVAATVVAQSLWGQGSFSLPDFFVCAVVVADALISPVNSFRSALRNVQAGVNTAPSERE